MVWVIAINQKPITQNYQNDVQISISSKNCPNIAKIVIFLLSPQKLKVIPLIIYVTVQNILIISRLFSPYVLNFFKTNTPQRILNIQLRAKCLSKIALKFV